MEAKSYALALLKYNGARPVDKETGEQKAFYKDGYRFEPSDDPEHDYIKEIPIEKANKWVARWPDVFEFIREKDKEAESVINQLLSRIKELENTVAKGEPKKAEKPKKDA